MSRDWESKGIPHDFHGVVSAHDVDVDAVKPSPQLDIARIRFPKIDGYLREIIDEGRRDISMLWICVDLEEEWIRVISAQLV
jgi:hypothetical protein